MKPGDVVVQLGNWHAGPIRGAQLMAFVMMGGSPKNETGSQDRLHRRREGKSKAIHDGPAPDVHGDPAAGFHRPSSGYRRDAGANRRNERAPLSPQRSLPRGGSLCRIVSFRPPRVPGGARAPHAGMQKTRTSISAWFWRRESPSCSNRGGGAEGGRHRRAAGTRHAWSNRSDTACVVAISSHDATY